MIATQEMAKKLMQVWRTHPDAFFHDALGADPWEKQVEILYSIRDNDRTAVRSSNACVAPETRITNSYTGEQVPIAEIQRGFPVWSVYPGTQKIVKAYADQPFIKGVLDLYRVTLENGSTFDCTLGHKVLTPRGYLPLKELHVGDLCGVGGPNLRELRTAPWRRGSTEPAFQDLPSVGASFLAFQGSLSSREKIGASFLAFQGSLSSREKIGASFLAFQGRVTAPLPRDAASPELQGCGCTQTPVDLLGRGAHCSVNAPDLQGLQPVRVPSRLSSLALQDCVSYSVLGQMQTSSPAFQPCACGQSRQSPECCQGTTSNSRDGQPHNVLDALPSQACAPGCSRKDDLAVCSHPYPLLGLGPSSICGECRDGSSYRGRGLQEHLVASIANLSPSGHFLGERALAHDHVQQPSPFSFAAPVPKTLYSRKSPTLNYSPIIDVKWSGCKQYWDVNIPITNNYLAEGTIHRNTGKDYLAGRATLWWLMCNEEAVVVTTAPNFNQVRNIIWREIHQAFATAKMPLWHEPPNKTEFSLGPKRYAIGLSSNEKERLTGIHAENILIIVTETSGMEDANMDALDTLTAGGNAKTLFISNPTRISGTFYRAFHTDRELYNLIHIPAWDTPNFTELNITKDDIRSGDWRAKTAKGLPRPYLITPKWVAEKYIKWGEDSQHWSAYIEAEFPEGDDKRLIPLSLLEAALDADPDSEETPLKSLGVDVARKGANRTVFTLMRGGRVLEQKEIGGSKTTETRDRVVAYIKHHGGSELLVSVDDGGIGGGLVDDLDELGYAPIPFIAGGRAEDPKLFANLLSESYWRLREAFLNHDISIPNHLSTSERLVAQLSKITYDPDFGPRQVLIVHKRGGDGKDVMEQESPDLADSLNIANYAQYAERGGDYFCV